MYYETKRVSIPVISECGGVEDIVYEDVEVHKNGSRGQTYYTDMLRSLVGTASGSSVSVVDGKYLIDGAVFMKKHPG